MKVIDAMIAILKGKSQGEGKKKKRKEEGVSGNRIRKEGRAKTSRKTGSWKRLTPPSRFQPSTLSARALNDRVRDVTACTLTALATNTLCPPAFPSLCLTA